MLDEYLIRRAQAGDRDALDRLVRRYYEKIYAYCSRHVGEKQAAEDLCQDTFVSMLEHIEDYRHYDKFQNYLYVVAGNKCRDFYRRKKPLCCAEVPEQPTAGSEEELLMRELVRKLPEELREAVMLRFYQELKYSDIAKILGISASLAKYRVKKAVACLREELEGEHE